MKKLFFYAMLAVGMTAACQKSDVNDETDVLDDNSPVEVIFGVNAPSITVTKTKAAVDDWTDQTVYVYGWDKTLGSSGAPSFELGNMLIQGASAKVTSTTPEVEYNTDPDISQLTFDKNNNNVDKYYYEVDAVYEFASYYIGDADIIEGPTVDATNKTVKAVVEIDGHNDIMIAHTNHTNDINKGKEMFPDATINESRVYSAYAARRGVHPTLNFDHKLTRFTFNIVQGYSPNDPTYTKDVEITKITVNTNYKGNLDLKAGTFSATSDTKDLTFTIADGKPEATPKKIEDIMIFPTASPVVFNVAIKPQNQESDPNTSGLTLKDMVVTLDPAKIVNGTTKAFEAGKRYEVTLTVYDLEEVKVSASLTEWVDGDSTVYDPDNDLNEEAGLKVTEAKLGGNPVTLYHKVDLGDGVRVYKNRALTQKADDGDYTTDTQSFTVTDGVVSGYTTTL